MTDFYSNFSSFEKDGQTAQQYFYKQIYEAFKENTQNNTLPFFNKDLNKIPRELTTGKVINNENSIALEQIASRYGYKSNLWIYGNELNKLQKEVGSLSYKKGTVPALCITKYFGATHLNEQDLYISESGTGNKEQYLYNLDSLTDRSREKVLKYFEMANNVDKSYTEANYKAFQSNIKLNKQGDNKTFEDIKKKVIEASNQNGLNLTVITNCHYFHNLTNSIGMPELAEEKTAKHKELCYQTSKEFCNKSNNVGAYKAGLMLCTALNAGTEFQRISVAKGYNLENAKRIEEMKVAETNRTRPYQRGGGGWSY
ncbi:MAG: hypothetical protein K6C98_02585 [Treponema sp.]|nr:hypothetical protein [Treponema sp.]